MYETFKTPPGRVVCTSALGERVFFTVDQPKDLIQKQHLKGRFYEPDELLIMSRVFPKGGRFLDIGANIGNHLVFFGRIMQAAHILPIEVNPRVIALLKSNIYLNGLDAVCDLSHLGKGLHSAPSDTASVRFGENNIGGGRVFSEGGDLQLVRGDDIFDSAYDLVKIDVEGLEIEVLKGMETFIRNTRPKMFVEVDEENADAFTAWTEQNGYVVIDQFQRYRNNVNYLIVHTDT